MRRFARSGLLTTTSIKTSKKKTSRSDSLRPRFFFYPPDNLSDTEAPRIRKKAAARMKSRCGCSNNTRKQTKLERKSRLSVTVSVLPSVASFVNSFDSHLNCLKRIHTYTPAIKRNRCQSQRRATRAHDRYVTSKIHRHPSFRPSWPYYSAVHGSETALSHQNTSKIKAKFPRTELS